MDPLSNPLSPSLAAAVAPQTVTVLGATGSIGASALDVIARHPDRFRIHALTAHRSVESLCELVLRHAPRYAVLRDEDAAEQLRQQLRRAGSDTEVLAGEGGLVQVAAAAEVDTVVAAIVGAAGLPSTLAAAEAGKRVLLVNKEALVSAGRLFMEAVAAKGALLLPVDSEHNAIFQCMPAGYRCGSVPAGVRRILLTGSGGPFRTRPLAELEAVTPAQACAHPNWSMGPKISVDSATMMNKGLELIEACWLFAASTEQVQIVVHPQSVIHSLVEYDDGSVLAQLGNPDMRTPIAHALAWPQRLASGVGPLDLIRIGRLDFEAPDYQRFPCLRLATEAFQRGGTAPALLNAANEEAVAAFLAGGLCFTEIPRLIETVLERVAVVEPHSLAEVQQADLTARHVAAELIAVRQPA